MTGNSSGSEFRTAEKDHCLPACLSFNLLDGHLHCDCEVINSTVRYGVRAFSTKGGSDNILLNVSVLSKQVVSMCLGFICLWESLRFLLQRPLLANLVVKLNMFVGGQNATLPTHHRHIKQQLL